jgi:hypothetical protein
MPKTKISEFSSTPANNTDIDSINIAEGCAPSGINDAIRELMAQLKDWQAGTSNDPMVIGSSGSLTLSQGTANGVTYLNGSKVVTSGTALVFDGTNLGVAVTPAAWSSGYKAIQIQGGALNSGATSQLDLSQNFSNVGGTNIYTTTNAASLYRQDAGAHKWFNAPSGTAGNAITFTQAMTLDASGRLGIGTTSPASQLHIYPSTANVFTEGLRVNREGQTGQYTIVNYASGIGRIVAVDSLFNAPSLGFFTSSDGSTQTERARIDSSGNLLVGNTSVTATPATGFCFSNPKGDTYAALGHPNGSASGNFYAIFNYNSSVIGSITQTGTTAVLFNTTSDQRLKENIKDSESSSSLIDSLKVRQFDWKSDNSHQRYGFVAQELVTVAPEAVHQPTDPEAMMAVDYSKLVPMLVKEVQSLRKRLADAGL